MNTSRKCSRCQNKLSSYTIGSLCHSCQEKAKEEINRLKADILHYDLEDMCFLLGLEAEESVKRIARKGYIPGRVPKVRKYLFFREDIDSWLKSGPLASSKMKRPVGSQPDDRRPSLQPILIAEEESPIFCLVSQVSQVDEDSDGVPIYKALALIDGKLIPVVSDPKKGCWLRE